MNKRRRWKAKARRAHLKNWTLEKETVKVDFVPERDVYVGQSNVFAIDAKREPK